MQRRACLANQLATRTYASAGGVVVDSRNGSVLVLVRPGRMGPNGHPEIRLPKGHIEPGESRPQAALREVQEEAGLPHLTIFTDLGHQIVEFDWKGYHVTRDESCFLMTIPPDARRDDPERQFVRLWLTWEDALAQLTFEAEREWVRRAHIAWGKGSKNVTDQDAQ